MWRGFIFIRECHASVTGEVLLLFFYLYVVALRKLLKQLEGKQNGEKREKILNFFTSNVIRLWKQPGRRHWSTRIKTRPDMLDFNDDGLLYACRIYL
jgi:hypothetical protein